MIEFNAVSKAYGTKTVLDSLTFTVQPGIVTGFLGPNGAGKSTAMRLLLGLEPPTTGTAKVGGRSYRDHVAPIREIGALLEARAINPARTARDHLLTLAHTHTIPTRRVDEVLDLVGLSAVARQRVRGFSLGMGQRLGIAGALLGDPRTIMLDEPVNGLDPEGIRWIRDLLKEYAQDGRTVFLSSHLMSEMALTADHLVVLGRGRVLADLSVDDLISSAGPTVVVRSPHTDRLRPLLAAAGATVTTDPDGSLEVAGLETADIGARAAAAGVVLHELTTKQASLEETFMELTAESVDYHGSVGASGPATGKAA